MSLRTTTRVIEPQKPFTFWTSLDVAAVMQTLGTSVLGLTSQEAAARLRAYGPNKIAQRETTFFSILWRQFNSPFIYLLLGAAVLSFAVGELHNGIILTVFIAINVGLSCFQEAKAHHAMALLQKYLPSQANVMRDGIWKRLDKSLLVPGDIVLLQAGDIAPADMRVMQADPFLIDESTLTGESIPVAKRAERSEKPIEEIFEAQNIIFAGTSLMNGQAHGIVVTTGWNTALGAISRAVSVLEHKGAYERGMLEFSKSLLRLVIISIVVIYVMMIFIKGSANAFDFSLFAIALLVSIVPEALPAVTTFALAQGATGLAKKGVVIKRLSAIEDLGDIEILCTDKTGTLTENKLSVLEIHAANTQTCLLYGLVSIANGQVAHNKSESPFDAPLKAYASAELLKQAKHDFTLGARMPFDSFRIRESVLAYARHGQGFLIVKGAPDKLIDLCVWESKQEKDAMVSEIAHEEELGHRTIAIAYKPYMRTIYAESDERDLQWKGYITFSDPLKKTAKDTIQLAKKLNVEIKIITGDSPHVATAIARELTLLEQTDKGVITGKELEKLSEADFAQACHDNTVFARISPLVKSGIIAALQKTHDVGFLGEGINDTPALKSANVGIVVDGAVDLARDVADIVLLHKDLKVLVEGIKYGRGIYANVNKYLRCTLSSNFGNAYSMAIVALFVPFLPILPVQILLINLLSDMPSLTIATDTNDVAELKKPKAYSISKTMFLVFGLAVVSLLDDLCFFGTFYRLVSKEMLRTLYFILSITTELILVFSVRTRSYFWRASRPSLPLIVAVTLIFALTVWLPFTTFGQEQFSFVAPSAWHLALLFVFMMGDFLGSESIKLWYYRRHNHDAGQTLKS